METEPEDDNIVGFQPDQCAPGGSLRVAVVCESPAPAHDGVSRYCTWLTEALRASGHSVSELRPMAPRRGWPSGVAVPANGNRVPVVVHRRSAGALRLDEFDVVHVQAPFSPQLMGPLVRALPERTALVATFHSTPRDRRAALALRAVARLGAAPARRLDAAVAVSPSAATAAWRAYSRRSTVLDPVVPANDPTFVGAGHRDAGSVVFLGRLVSRKGAVELVDAFARASVDRHDWRLDVIGDGPLRGAVSDRARACRVTSKVRLRGALGESEMSQALHCARLVCAPSTGGESFGMVLIDAMRHGAVVLGGANSGHRYALGRPGAVADVRDPGGYAELIRRHMSDEALRRLALAHQTERLRALRPHRTLPPLIHLYREAIRRRR